MAVVFGPDTFTVGADVNIDAYPATPDYAYNEGSGTNMRVNAANDRVQAVLDSVRLTARCINAAAPTGDQEATATIAGANYDESHLCVRMAVSGTLTNFYLGIFQTREGNEVWLGRLDDGALVSLASADRGLTAGTHTARIKATGAGATVSLEFQIDATTMLTYDDSSATRKTSGPSGFGVNYQDTNACWIDNFQIDDLAAGGSILPLVAFGTLGGNCNPMMG